MRKMLADRRAAAPIPPPPPEITETDITIPSRDGTYQIPIRITRPTSLANAFPYPSSSSSTTPSTPSAPLIVYFHGGGFCLGDLSDATPTCRAFSSRSSAVCINVDYRLAPEFPFPTCMHDSWDALVWAVQHASQLGAATDRLVVGGTSAGANISAVMALLARDDYDVMSRGGKGELAGAKITGLELIIPPVTGQHAVPEVYRGEITSYEQNKDSPILGQSMIDLFMDSYAPEQESRLYNVLLELVRTGDWTGLPPKMVFQICGMDPLRDEGIIFEREVREKAGTQTKLYMYEGLPHGFWGALPMLKVSKKAIQETTEGMVWLLGLEEETGGKTESRAAGEEGERPAGLGY
jgi:acetyl esterase/lipase